MIFGPFSYCMLISLFELFTVWKVSKYGVFSGPYFPVFRVNAEIYGPEKTPYLDTFHEVFNNFFVGWVRTSVRTFRSFKNMCSFFSIQIWAILIVLYISPRFTSFVIFITQLTFSYSKSTIEALEKGVRYV